MKLLFLLFTSAIGHICLFSQTKLNIIYKETMERTNIPTDSIQSSEDTDYQLVTVDTFYFLNVNKNNSEYYNSVHKQAKVEATASKKNYIFRDLENNIQIKASDIKQEPIKSELPKYEWVTTSETKRILGYSVKKAYLVGAYEFLNIEAWFPTSLPFQHDPGNFYGLPGLKLELESKDEKNKFIITAASINMSKDTKPITFNR